MLLKNGQLYNSCNNIRMLKKWIKMIRTKVFNEIHTYLSIDIAFDFSPFDFSLEIDYL